MDQLKTNFPCLLLRTAGAEAVWFIAELVEAELNERFARNYRELHANHLERGVGKARRICAVVLLDIVELNEEAAFRVGALRYVELCYPDLVFAAGMIGPSLAYHGLVRRAYDDPGGGPAGELSDPTREIRVQDQYHFGGLVSHDL